MAIDNTNVPPASVPPVPPQGRQPSRGRKSALWIGIVVVAVVLAGGFSVYLSRGNDHGNAPATQQAQSGQRTYYTCGMHPWVILPNPGDCPICHMKLVPLDVSKFTGEVAISPVITQDIGVRIAQVKRGPVTRTIRTVGNVDYDETAVRDVNTKIEGWIEKLHVAYTGQKVKKGQPLFELYSPELYNAQQDYLLAVKGRQSGAGKDLLDRVRQRLEYLDVTPGQIAALEKSGKPAKTMTVYSPFDGMVVAKSAMEGMKVDAGAQMYRIADLSRVWVMVTLYEYQLPFVEVGQDAVMTLPYIPGQQFEGKVTYIYPFLNPETRQVKVRLEFPNPDNFLKPGMFANVDLHSTLAKERILVPREAVIDTGERQVAFVSLGEGRFEPRVVKLGPEAQEGMVVVLDGLKEGESVVTSGQFLLDSESRLREALAKMIKGDLAADQQTAAAPAKPAPGGMTTLPADAQKQLAAILDGYFAISNKLADDSTAALAEPSGKVTSAVDALLKIEVPDNEHFWHQHEEVAVIRGKALELAQTKDIAKAREQFADMSIATSKLLKAVGVPRATGKEVHELHCPMYRSGQGGTSWLEPAGSINNPYMGKSMLRCYDTKAALPAAAK